MELKRPKVGASAATDDTPEVWNAYAPKNSAPERPPAPAGTKNGAGDVWRALFDGNPAYGIRDADQD